MFSLHCLESSHYALQNKRVIDVPVSAAIELIFFLAAACFGFSMRMLTTHIVLVVA